MTNFSTNIIRAIWVCLLLTVAIGSFTTTAIGQGREIGTMTADKETVSWSPIDGPPTDGSLRGAGVSASAREKLDAIFIPTGLKTARGVVPSSSIILRIDPVTGDRTQIVFGEVTVGTPPDMLWSAGQATVVAEDDVWFGDVVTYDAGTTIEGEVLGSVVSISGDVSLGRGASIRGDVVVIGGVLRQQPDAKIYGRVFATGGHRRPRLFIPTVGELDERGYEWRPSLSYDRADGLRPGVGGTIQGDNGSLELNLWTGYGLSSKTWQYRIEFMKHFLPTRSLRAAASIYRLTMTEDDDVIGRDENTIYALVAGSDYRDYVGVDGGDISLRWKYRELGTFTTKYVNHDFRPMSAHLNLWHLFRSDEEFRRNFSTLGDGFDADSVYDSRSSALVFVVKIAPVSSGQHPIGFNGSLEASYEVAGGGLGGGFDYDRIILNGKGWWDSGHLHKFTLRTMIGSARRNVPPHKLFYLGGMGSLRGYKQKEFAGADALLVNLEYHFKYWENPFGDAAVILLLDIGRATFEDDLFDLDDLKSDVGIGLDFGESIRLNAAKALDEAKRDLKITLKLSRSF